MLGVIMNWRTG